jgi:hypothetical protein
MVAILTGDVFEQSSWLDCSRVASGSEKRWSYSIQQYYIFQKFMVEKLSFWTFLEVE